MEVKFANRRLERLVSNYRQLVRDYGTAVAKAVPKKIDDLRSAENIADYILNYPGKSKELTDSFKGQFSVRLDDKVRLVFSPNEQETPRKPDGGLDWHRITKIVITAIVDYHLG